MSNTNPDSRDEFVKTVDEGIEEFNQTVDTFIAPSQPESKPEKDSQDSDS